MAVGLRIACRGVPPTSRPGSRPVYGSAGMDRRWGRISMRASILAMGARGTCRRVRSTSHLAVVSLLRVLPLGAVALGNAIRRPGGCGFGLAGAPVRSSPRPRPDDEPAAWNRAAMVGNLLSATTGPAAARGPARPGETSGSPSADPTCADLPHARRRLATVRPEVPHRSRPPPCHDVTRFACPSANPRGMPCVWRDRPSPVDSGAVYRRPSKCELLRGRPDPTIPEAARRPTLDPGPFLLQISTPLV